MSKFENFERAFDAHVGSCHRMCECGKIYYNSNGGWDWEDGELDRLEADTEAIDQDWAIGKIIFEGIEYVSDCDCWHDRAKQIIRFIDGHADQIAKYLTLEKQRKTKEAKNSPVVK